MAFIPEPSVAIVLVNWNGFEFTEACLQSLQHLEFPDYKIIVVDNASENQEGSRLNATYPDIHLIQNEQNLGFTGGNNVGIRKALEDGYTHIMLLNNDTEVEADFLGEMIRRFQSNSKLGMVQPLICFLHEKEQIWSAGGKWNSFLGRAITLGDRKFLSNAYVADRPLDWATGCCMLVTREALLKVGLLNEGYFAYFEDVEWSLRFRENGYGIALASKAKIYHEAGASSKKKHSEGTLSARVFYLHVRNQLFLLRSACSGWEKPFAFAYHFSRFSLWMGYFFIRGRFQKLKSVARGIRDGLNFPLQNPLQWP